MGELSIIKALPGNDKCADCGRNEPRWASVSFGTTFCLECSGIHRSLGVHISFVRSIHMDSWTDYQLSIMKKGGNAACAKYLKEHEIVSSTPIRQKYSSPAAQLYKEILKARAMGLPEPKNSLKYTLNEIKIDQLKGESDEQYKIRRTCAEAEARMIEKFGANREMSGIGNNNPSKLRRRYLSIVCSFLRNIIGRRKKLRNKQT